MPLIKMPAVRNVIASSVATLEIPVGPTYNGLMLELGGTAFTKTHISKIELRLNSKPFMTWSGNTLQSRNDYLGESSVVTHLFIPFIEAKMKSFGGMYGGQLVTDESSGVKDFIAEITIGAATAPELDVWAEVQEAPPKGSPGRDLITGVFYRPENIAGADTWPIVTPHGRNAQRILKRLYIFDATPIVTAISVKKNGIPIYEDVTIAANDALQAAFYKVPQTNVVVFDPVVLDDAKRGVNMGNARHWQIDVTTDAAGTLYLYEEVIGKLRLF